MSTYLWRYYLEDDVARFCELLAAAQLGPQTATQKVNQRGSSSGTNLTGTSPLDYSKTRSATKASPHGPIYSLGKAVLGSSEIIIGREDVNRRDSKGLTLLHHVATSSAQGASIYANALLSHPHIDLYVQDYESGWTALHRAFYFGNITVARAIIEVDSQTSVTQLGTGGSMAVRSLIKIKDKEGLGPYDLLAATITDRTLRQHQEVQSSSDDGSSSDDHEEASIRSSVNRLTIDTDGKATVVPLSTVNGDELFTFGSNRNITLGFGDEDDRQFPERINIRRPAHLFRRFFREATEAKAHEFDTANAVHAQALRDQVVFAKDFSELPSVIRARRVVIQDVQMAKFSTAVLTNDPVSNMYICGHGPGGRLGFGNEQTQFQLACLDDFGSSHRKIIAVALGQDHSLAVTDCGELYTWGSNVHGQLGTGLPKQNAKPEDNTQLGPKRLYGVFKRDIILGVAASRIHSVAHTSTSVYTWGKNHGQLGLVDARAGSLDIQPTPRKVAASRFSASIQSVSANERATTCLLENHEVHVFANYGLVKLQFPLESFSNYFLKSSFSATKYNKVPNKICKISSGGDTICALSSAGEVFTVTVNQLFDPESSSSASTTHPNKIKAALTAPYRAWSLKKDDLAARDVGVDQDGSVILSTQAGSVWRRVRRPKAAVSSVGQQRPQRSKDFKFMRVPNLTRVVAVRASASGAYCAIKSDCNIIREMVGTGSGSLKLDIFKLHPFRFLVTESDEDLEVPLPVFWQRPTVLARMINRMSQLKDPDAQLAQAFANSKSPSGFDMTIGTTSSDVQIPLHQFLFSGRSIVGRDLLTGLKSEESWPWISSIVKAGDGTITMILDKVDPLTLFQIVFFLYTDTFVSFWQSPPSHLAYRYRQLRPEIMKVASSLGLSTLESAVRRMFQRAEPSIEKDFETAIADPKYFNTGDAIVQLADGECRVHSDLLSIRCPFFEGLFQGHAGGRWLAQRQEMLSEPDDLVRIDLSHVELRIFRLVLRYVYADSGERLFDDVVTQDLEEFQDLVVEVMSVANELMLDRLSTSCQAVLGRYVNIRNACQLLNAVAPSSVKDFKTYVLEYICRNLEPLLCNHHLDELDDDLMHELDEIVRGNQLDSLPIARSNYAFTRLLDRYPELVDIAERSRQARLDVLNLRTRFADKKDPLTISLLDSEQAMSASAATRRKMARLNTAHSPPIAPKIELAVPEPNLAPSASEIEVTLRSDGIPMSPQNGSERSSPAESPLPQRKSSEDRVLPQAISRSTSGPWAPSTFSADKLDMKDIMTQASSSRISNLSSGLQSSSRHEDQNRAPNQSKMSQKERKRRQQQRDVTESATSPSALDASQASPRPSPWKTVNSPKPPTITSSSPLEEPQESRTATAHQRSVTTPQLTMRQTVAHTPPQKRNDRSSITQNQEKTQGSASTRSVSSPQVPQQSPSTRSPESTSRQTEAPIRSVQHQPSPAARKTPGLAENHSLAEIIYEEQAGKTAIKDAVAKRSLQEIQQEQEFQQWWDQESRAVQEAATKSVSPRDKSNAQSRGRRRGKGKEKQKEKNGGHDAS
ncbi:MAG: hypothetical protein M1828_004093 [Chrysothrix sp. TS-e1954]|nr:MAG: hypothetical protein M1828_004093 [Chrysothrix sp. TS-e1954]